MIILNWFSGSDTGDGTDIVISLRMGKISGFLTVLTLGRNRVGGDVMVTTTILPFVRLVSWEYHLF